MFDCSLNALMASGRRCIRYNPFWISAPSITARWLGLTGRSLGYFIPSDEYLQIDSRTTEERACLDPYIGDESIEVILDNMYLQQQTGAL